MKLLNIWVLRQVKRELDLSICNEIMLELGSLLPSDCTVRLPDYNSPDPSPMFIASKAGAYLSTPTISGRHFQWASHSQVWGMAVFAQFYTRV